MQHQDGYWWAELQSNVTITAEYIMLLQFLGLAESSKITRLANYLLDHQLENGGWSIYEGDGGDLSTSVEAYLGLKLAGHAAQEPALQRAREFIQSSGRAAPKPGLHPDLPGPVPSDQLAWHTHHAGGVRPAAVVDRLEHL